MGKFRSTTDVVPAIYKPGERFAQLVIIPIPDIEIKEVAELEDSDRGEGGYGSSDNISAVQLDENTESEVDKATYDSPEVEQAAEQVSSEQV